MLQVFSIHSVLNTLLKEKLGIINSNCYMYIIFGANLECTASHMYNREKVVSSTILSLEIWRTNTTLSYKKKKKKEKRKKNFVSYQIQNPGSVHYFYIRNKNVDSVSPMQKRQNSLDVRPCVWWIDARKHSHICDISFLFFRYFWIR